ncbi:MAG TPA: GIY-YIG nuclease family protein [Allosphingosinicella sp.]
MDRDPFVYILASGFRGTLYIGVTSDLAGRLWKHRSGTVPGFTARYSVHRLVYFEPSADMDSAIAREKQLKRWHRQWKINLIEERNPHWDDLAVAFGFEPLSQMVTDDANTTLDSETSSG